MGEPRADPCPHREAGGQEKRCTDIDVSPPVVFEHTQDAHREEHGAEGGPRGGEEGELHQSDHSNYHDNASADSEETGEDPGNDAERNVQETHCGLLVPE